MEMHIKSYLPMVTVPGQYSKYQGLTLFSAHMAYLFSYFYTENQDEIDIQHTFSIRGQRQCCVLSLLCSECMVMGENCELKHLTYV